MHPQQQAPAEPRKRRPEPHRARVRVGQATSARVRQTTRPPRYASLFLFDTVPLELRLVPPCATQQPPHMIACLATAALVRSLVVHWDEDTAARAAARTCRLHVTVGGAPERVDGKECCESAQGSCAPRERDGVQAKGGAGTRQRASKRHEGQEGEERHTDSVRQRVNSRVDNQSDRWSCASSKTRRFHAKARGSRARTVVLRLAELKSMQQLTM